MSISTDKSNPREFKLLRHFALTALVSIAAAAFMLSSLYGESTRLQFMADAEKYHTDVVRLYRNFIWPNYAEFLLKLDENTITSATDSPTYQSLHKGVIKEILESQVLKIKIFNKQGLTVYSSDPNQMGQIKSGYAGFEAAIRGKISSILEFRESFDTGEMRELVNNAQVYSSYIPVFDSLNTSNVVAVFELYSDITPVVNNAELNRNKLLTTTVTVMLLLFCVLLVNVKRADRTIKEHKITQQKMKEQAYWQANHDALTQLPNRHYFHELLSDNLKSIENSSKSIALMFIDLDFFKPINDAHGHQTGDLVLQEVAKRIQNALHPEAIVARLGGDEFTVLIKIDKNNADISQQAENLLQALKEPYQFDEIKCTLSASIGITYCDNSKTQTETLIAEADNAMYLSKKMGRDSTSTYLGADRKHAA